MSDLERIENIREILDDLPFNHPLKIGKRNIYFYESHLTDLFRRMKAENWTPQFITQKIAEYIDDLPSREAFIYKRSGKKFKKGDLKIGAIQAEINRLKPLQAAAWLLPVYQEKLEAYKRYDYEDMILWVLKAFKENEMVLRRYQEQYLYFLVDEYQDTNGSQNEILRQLIDYWDNPNVFIVGDDDQSIFEFQGARLKNLVDFYDEYKKEMSLIVLKENYRSSPHILDAAATVIRHNEKRIINALQIEGLTKDLIASNEAVARTANLPVINEYLLPLHEITDIATQIETIHAQGVPYGEMAIIYAKHKQSIPIIELLEKKKIPFTTKRRTNILNLPVIRQLRSLLEYFHLEINKPYSGEHILYRMMYYRFFGLDTHDLGKITFYISKASKKNELKFRDCIHDMELLQKAGVRHTEAIQDFSALIEYFLSVLPELSVSAFAERLINRSGFLSFILNHEDKPELLQALHTFMDFLKKETAKKPRIKLSRVLTLFKQLDENNLTIPINSYLLPQEGVQLMTAHAAKGLEFRAVFVPSLLKNFWEPQKVGARFHFSFPDTITLSGEEDALEARRRLFYVAITRAKEFLFVSYYREDESGKEFLRSIFVDELLEMQSLKVTKKTPDIKTLIENEALLLSEKQPPETGLPDKATIDLLLKDFKLSASSLNKYLRCPLSFYYENVLRVPGVTSEAAMYGTAIHNALEILFKKMLITPNNTFLPVKQFIRIFEREMRKLRGFFSKQGYQQRYQTGRANLEAYYQHHVEKWRKNVKVELKIRNTAYKNVPIKGQIDKLEILDGTTAHIVDYKTGAHDTKKLKPASAKNEIGGDFWRQLVFYKILYRSQFKIAHVIKTAEISYADPTKDGAFVSKIINISNEDIESVGKLITETYAKIMSHEFYRGCNEDNCHWCNFVKNDKAPDSFTDSSIEDLDDKL